MKLKYLEYFLSVAELGNITHAAQQLYLSQPNLTVAMKRLEEELGVTLLERHNKSVTLTDDGQFLYDKLNTLVIKNAIHLIDRDFTLSLDDSKFLSNYLFDIDK